MTIQISSHMYLIHDIVCFIKIDILAPAGLHNHHLYVHQADNVDILPGMAHAQFSKEAGMMG